MWIACAHRGNQIACARKMLTFAIQKLEYLELHLRLGYLDEQFCQVEDLQDEASLNFAEEVVTLFFKDFARLISNIEQALVKYPKDFNKWDAYMQQLKGSCSSIGASRMKSECMSFRDYRGQGNVEGCMKSFQKVKREHGALRQKLEAYFQLLRQAGPAGAATRPAM
ncbi:hypothetical protein C2845_PM08G25220 [Panicum miliaceum]|uniref:Histidine-containing phosphotransfer protein n=1 Tax=Panicum miliaceum TaxID=4540 RepID=A0A3L6QYE3_PANMI|nr:hypothetical protein C2845_PM08G25220 [Panicum miliaceum]